MFAKPTPFPSAGMNKIVAKRVGGPALRASSFPESKGDVHPAAAETEQKVKWGEDQFEEDHAGIEHMTSDPALAETSARELAWPSALKPHGGELSQSQRRASLQLRISNPGEGESVGGLRRPSGR